MSKAAFGRTVLAALLVALPAGISGAFAKDPKVLSDQTISGIAFPESVACDAQGKALYASLFVSELKPTQKDGKGKITKLSLTGEILEDQFLPAAGGEALNKPKGSWVKGNRLWVADIDVVWLFDIKSRKGKKVALPDIQFANDLVLQGNALYVSDNRADRLYRVEPADFLNSKSDPKITVVFSDKGVNPNGIYPAKDGSMLMVGFKSAEEARGIYSVDKKGNVKELSKPIGRLDGLYQMSDGTILATDWNSGSLFSWTAKDGVKTLASNFKGPADLCTYQNGKGLMVVVPDLAKSELRLIQLSK